MKKILAIVLIVVSACCLFACGGGQPATPSFTNIVFNDVTIDYDGNEHTIVATGIPADASVTYTNEGPFVLPGKYDIGVKVEKEGYLTYEDTATLTINALTFTNVVFNDLTIDYDGKEHTIVATGVPAGASVTYTNEGPYTNAGEYTISVSVSAQGYNTYTKTAKLTINKIDFPSSIVFDDDKVMYTGTEKSIEISGDVPVGTKIVYTNNKGTKVGTYEASVTLTNPNYNPKTMYATLKIYNVLNVAKDTLNILLDRPDPWSFMPEAFAKENLAYSSNPTKDFTNFVSVSSVNKKFMGKQMYVLWDGVRGMESLLEKFDIVYAVGETIASVYQAFINDNPEDYAEWVGEAAGFKVKIVLNGKQYTMLAGNEVFSLELFADADTNLYKGRIQLANDSGVLNYEMKDNYLKFNIGLTISGVMTMRQVEFVRDDDTVAGYFYQYLGLESAAVKTSAVIAFNSDYAIVMSAKRESDDLIIEGYEEVYSAKTGEFISAEVLETNKLVEFDTYWVNAFDVSGISSIKAVENDNVALHKNHHDVYINGESTTFVPKYNSILGVPTSRKFDIEMRTVYYVTKVTDGDKIKYELLETEIPMVFVQVEAVDGFGKDAMKENENVFATQPTLPTQKIQLATTNFNSLKSLLDEIKEQLTYQELVNQLGTKDSFFDKTV